MRRRALALILTALAGYSAAAQQKSIFDDDWVPPKAAPAEAKPTRPPATPAPAPVEPDKSATAPDAPPSTPATPTIAPAPKVVVVPLPLPVTRRPVPAAPEQAAVRKVMKELFGPQLADRTPAGRKALFAKLVAQAERSADLPVERFVLLAAAHDAAIGAGDLALVARAADALGRSFDVDPLAIQAAAAPAVLRAGSAPREAVAGNVRGALSIARALAAAGDYAGAVKVAQSALPVAAGSGEADLRAAALATARDVTALRDAAARIAKDLDRLAADPDDPAANLAVGRHWCFDLNAWPAGLPKLARGSDPALKALAERDLAGPKAGAPLADLADAWWDVAARFPEGLTRSNVTAHAADLYRRAAPALAGMRLRLAEQRAGDGGAPKLSPTKPATPDKPTSPPTVATGARGGKAYDLLPLIDLAETGTPGRWERTPAGAIRTIPANKADRIEIPASLPDEYDLALVLERTEGENSIAVQMSAGDARFEIGVSGKQKRISVRANGENGKQFGTAIGELSFTNGKRQTLTYEVRRSGVRVLVDGAALAKIEGAKMTHWRMSDKEAPRTPRAPVIGNYDGSYLIHAVTLTDVSATFVLPTVAVAPPVLAAATVPTPATPVKPTTPPPAIPAADGRRAVDLLPLFDVNAGVVSGEWRKKDNALLFDGGKDARIQSAYKPPAEYDFVIEFTRVKGSGNIVQLCAREGVAFEWSIGASGGTTRLQNVNGHARNATQRKIPDGLADTDRHTSVVQVRATGVRVLLDGNEQLDFKTDYADLSRNGSWKLRDDAFLGLGGWEQPIVFHRVTVIEGAPK